MMVSGRVCYSASCSQTGWLSLPECISPGPRRGNRHSEKRFKRNIFYIQVLLLSDITEEEQFNT